MTVSVAERVTQPYRPLGRYIAARRKALRLSQRELSRAAGLADSYVGLIELGRHRPEPDRLRALARVLGVDYSDLAQLAGFMQRPQGDVVSIDVPVEKASLLRRAAELPRRALEIGIETAGRVAEAIDAFTSEPVLPESSEHDQAEAAPEAQHERDAAEQIHPVDPDTAAQG